MSFDSTEDKQKETFRRLRILTSKGYKVGFRHDQYSETIDLKHPGKGPDIFMFSNGCIGTGSMGPTIALTSQQEDVTRIYNDCHKDKVRFDSWASTVQDLTNWQRFRTDFWTLIFHSRVF